MESPQRGDVRTMLDVLELPEPERHLLVWLVRRKRATLGELAAFLGQDEKPAQAMAAGLEAKGYVRVVEEDGQTFYLPRLTFRPGRAPSHEFWDALGDKGETR